jgi:hypothetical protein
VLVLPHGAGMDGSLWRNGVGDLRRTAVELCETLPLGGHRRSMRPDTDLSTLAVVRLGGRVPRGVGPAPGDPDRKRLGRVATARLRGGRRARRAAGARLVRGLRQLPPGVPGCALVQAAGILGSIGLASPRILATDPWTPSFSCSGSLPVSGYRNLPSVGITPNARRSRCAGTGW